MSALGSATASRLKHQGYAAKLNLVSLMDIFTILVFFLIVNQSEVRVLDTTNQINLPVSLAEKLPNENVLITVLDKSVIVQGRAVWQQESALSAFSSDDDLYQPLIEAVKTELSYIAGKRPQLSEQEQELGRAVTIIGDASVPYQVLKQIMAACADSNYRNMSLAVKQLLKNTTGEVK